MSTTNKKEGWTPKLELCDSLKAKYKKRVQLIGPGRFADHPDPGKICIFNDLDDIDFLQRALKHGEKIVHRSWISKSYRKGYWVSTLPYELIVKGGRATMRSYWEGTGGLSVLASWLGELKHPWLRMASSDGRHFFWNIDDCVSTWCDPRLVVEVKDDNEGRVVSPEDDHWEGEPVGVLESEQVDSDRKEDTTKSIEDCDDDEDLESLYGADGGGGGVHGVHAATLADSLGNMNVTENMDIEGRSGDRDLDAGSTGSGGQVDPDAHKERVFVIHRQPVYYGRKESGKRKYVVIDADEVQPFKKRRYDN